MYAELLLGGGWYNKEGTTDSDLAYGLGGGYHVNDDIAIEGRLAYQPVFGDEYYFMTLGARYNVLAADFFMTPSFEIHGGVLVPQGEKSDMDGVFGLGARLLYKTRWDIEFGPSIGGDLVFEGPHQSIWLDYMFVARFNF